MASTPNHAAQGALLTLAIVRLIGWLLSISFPVLHFFLTPLHSIIATALVTLGAVVGAAPDLIGWIGRIGRPWDWDLYNDAHEGQIAKQLGMIPPYTLHILVDRLFHSRENGGHWWPKLDWLEILLWIGTAAGFWFLL